MFVHSNANINIVDFREKAFSLFFFYALLISSAVQDRLWGLLAPWPSVFSGIDYLGYTCLPIALLC